MTHYLRPSVKKFILDFVNGRKCQIHYGTDEEGNKLVGRSFMLHEKNYDRRMAKIHEKFNRGAIGLHCTPARYILYPIRAEGIYALDLVLDFDGNGYEENHDNFIKVKDFFLENGLKSWLAWRTRGKHDGIQMKVPFECFIDKININENDIIKIKHFYLKLGWILNNIITTGNTIELKIYNSTFRVPLTFNESTLRFCNVIYNGGDTEYLSGENLMQRVEKIWNYPYYNKQMRKAIRFPRLSRKQQKQVFVTENISVKIKDFPPCFKTGMFTMVKKNHNREMIIFATWCFLKSLGWNDKSIINYLMRWKYACKIDDEMDFDIKKKHVGRKLGGISCEYIKNRAKFCPVNCGRISPLEGLKRY
ncbi:MAG: hypothetical protein DRI44_06100 [Chlamydiae bacterium]|nr:MAG: hypothetical protein DRI44_06100 [Chlamydiota bacterium]